MRTEERLADRATQEASDWLVRLQQDNVIDEDVNAWLQWCKADSANLEAFERVQELYDQLQALPLAGRQMFSATVQVTPERRAPVRQHLPLAASTALVFLFVVLWFGFRQEPPLPENRDYLAPRGALQSLQLSDRSQVTLGSESELSSDFTNTTRYADLRRGEAYFEVQHEQRRPFVVSAGAMTVTAVGTKFSVRISGSRTVVAVTEGAVDVTIDDSKTISSPLRIRAGQQAARDSGHAGLTVADVTAEVATSWRKGRFEYVMEPLSSVVESVNRYTSRRIVIDDPAVGAMSYTGTVFFDRLDEWAMSLPTAFPIVVSAAPDGTVILKLKSSAASPAIS